MAALPLPSRDDLEAELMKALGKVDRATRKKIVDALGDPPKVENLTSDLWNEVTTAYQQAVTPTLETTFLTAAQTLSENVGIGLDWTLVNQRAADWASRYTYDLVRGATDNSRRFLQQAVSDFYNGSIDNAHLQTRIARVFGPARASGIAVTEVTRASVEGDKATVDELARLGLTMEGFWDTVSDGHVCAICDGNNGKPCSQVGYPPGHPKCRCGCHYKVTANKSVKALVIGQLVYGWSSKRTA